MHKHCDVIINYMCKALWSTVCPSWLCYEQLVWQFVGPLIHKEHWASCGEEGLSPRAWSVYSHTQPTHKHTSHTSQKAQQCEHWPVWEAGLHGAHRGLHGHFSWRLVLPVLLVTEEEEASQLLTPRGQKSWKESRRRVCKSAVWFLGEITAEVTTLYCKHCKTCKNWLCEKRKADENNNLGTEASKQN